MYPKIVSTIESIISKEVDQSRKSLLDKVASEMQEKSDQNLRININCICTHNSRRSHLCQVWAKVASMHYRIRKTNTYSGGTEATAVFPHVIKILIHQGFKIHTISEGKNPVYALKYDAEAPPIHLFSKKYDDPYNPESNYFAFMNCSDADEKCPYIPGAEKRHPVKYVDPKRSDGTNDQDEIYLQSSELIASEMFYLFSRISK